jgi:hypothetical protein
MLTYLPIHRRVMRLLKLSCCVHALCLGIVVSVIGQAPAARHRVLHDGSGSMKGFFTTGQLQELQKLLGDSCGSASDSYYFVDYELVPATQEPTSFGGSTYLRNALDRGLAQKPAPAILWLVTDNQPSSGNQTLSDQDIGQFYESLRSDVVKRLYFFPLRLSFKGTLFRDDGHTVLTPNYEGYRGLLVYALLLDERAGEEFERSTSEFQSSFRKRGTEISRILIKPLEQDTITARLIPGEKFRVENGNQLVAGDFVEGSPITGNFKIELTSQLGQMKVSKADIDVRVPDKFRTGDFTESEIRPNFTPRNIQNFEPQNKQVIDVALTSDGVNIRNNPISWWNCIANKRGDITGNIQITVNVAPKNFDVVSGLANEFSTQGDIYQSVDPGVQSKIFKLDDLVKKMMPERQVNIRPRIGNTENGSIPIRMSVLYPNWPAMVLIGLLLSLLLLALYSWRFFSQQPLYRLTWDGGRYRHCGDFRLYPFVGRSIELDNRAAATIKKTMGGIRVRAANGHTVDDGRNRILNRSGTDFNVSHSAIGAGVNFYFSSVTAASPGLSSRDDSGSILEGIDYGRSDDVRNASVGSVSAPPVRKATTRASRAQHSDGNTKERPDLDSL